MRSYAKFVRHFRWFETFRLTPILRCALFRLSIFAVNFVALSAFCDTDALSLVGGHFGSPRYCFAFRTERPIFGAVLPQSIAMSAIIFTYVSFGFRQHPVTFVAAFFASSAVALKLAPPIFASP